MSRETIERLFEAIGGSDLEAVVTLLAKNSSTAKGGLDGTSD